MLTVQSYLSDLGYVDVVCSVPTVVPLSVPASVVRGLPTVGSLTSVQQNINTGSGTPWPTQDL